MKPRTFHLPDDLYFATRSPKAKLVHLISENDRNIASLCGQRVECWWRSGSPVKVNEICCACLRVRFR